MNNVTLDIANEFSRYPAGRTNNDGRFNGNRFREELLRPRLQQAIRTGNKLEINFEGVRTFGSSFLEQSFGGLVRINKIDKKVALNTIIFTYVSPVYRNYVQLSKRYIKEAAA